MQHKVSPIIMAVLGGIMALVLTLVGFASLVPHVQAQGGTVKIHDIQGAGHTSPLVGQVVTEVFGIVTVVELGDGFYMQDPNPDNNIGTSEGIFIDDVTVFPAVGDAVLISGTVEESGFGNDLTLTRIEITGTPTISSSGNAVPTPTVLGNGGRVPPDKIIDDDGLTSFDPISDGIDFYESVEGMLVQVNEAMAVGPTSRFGEIPIVGDLGANAGDYTAVKGLIIQEDYSDFNPERIHIDDEIVFNEPQVAVGDRFTGPITGAISYSFGNFKLINSVPLPAVDTSSRIAAPEITSLEPVSGWLRVASFNVLNLDPSDPVTQFNRIASAIVTNMKSPDIVGLQEIQDNTGGTDDGVVDATDTYTNLIAAIQTAGGPTYVFTDIAPVNNLDGGAPGSNIRVGFLYNPARVALANRPTGDATTAVTVTKPMTYVQLSLNPGRIDPNNLAFTDSRKPLAAEFIFQGKTVIVVNNHFNSKSSDNALFGAIQPPVRNSEIQRTQIATVVNSFVDSILALDPGANVIVMGDLNDFHFSPVIKTTLAGGVLTNLMDTIPKNDRYSFIFEGNSQTLDHVLVSSCLLQGAKFDIVHVNINFPASAVGSDHDPVLTSVVPGCTYYVPTIFKNKS